MNPFQNLYDRFNLGTNQLQSQDMPNGPMMVDIEPVGLCNFRCVMCPTGLQSLTRPGGFMSWPTYKAIVDKTWETNAAIRFIGWGEPTMHPNLIAMVVYASEKGRITHLNTNGSKINDILARKLCQAGLTSIKFSFQGVDRESYAGMRRVDFFDGLLDAIKTVREVRDERDDKTRPFIAVSTTTTDEPQDKVDEFKALMEPLVDQLSVGKTIFDYIDFAEVPKRQRERFEKAAAGQTVVKKHPNPCPEVWNKLSIHWDGKAVVCCNDYDNDTCLGNITEDDISDIWNHITMRNYRARLYEDQYHGKLCGSCYDYMDLTKGE